MKERMKKYLSMALRQDLKTEEDVMNDCVSKANSALFLGVISVILTILNVYNGWWFMASTTFVLIVGFVMAYLFAKAFRKPEHSAAVMALMVGLIFSVYLVNGENEGFAALWVLLVPLLGMGVLSLKSALILDLYFQILLILLFYTPLRERMREFYSATFIIRFPVLYFCSFGSALILSIQKQYYINLVKRQGNRDSLTDLWNRNACMQFMKANKENPDLSIAFLDLNGLKDVNDTLGHAAGDEYIVGCAECMRRAFSEGTLLARIGGDEFAAIGSFPEEKWAAQIDKFRREVAAWTGRLVETMTVSVGSAALRDHPDLTVEQLLKTADMAMYQEKSEYYKAAKPHDFEYDYLTGLSCSNKFHRDGNLLINAHPDEYTLVYIDFVRFKAINDLFGVSAGDALLRATGEEIKKCTGQKDLPCRLSGDRFAVLLHKDADADTFTAHIHSFIQKYDLPYEIICNMGIYQVEKGISIAGALDRAILALSTIKGSYVEKQAWYTDEMHEKLISEQEIAGMAGVALSEHQFIPYFQPQYDSNTGKMTGAEALARWNHPVRGLISPGFFVPIMERVGYVSQLDMYMFEESCRFLSSLREKGITPVPVSTNFSRYDIFKEGFVENLEKIREKYGVDAGLLHIEITESAVTGSSHQVNLIVENLHQKGYVVEMDDFGSGYSSLNVLKEIDFDIIKLDMRFLTDSDSKRGGTILNSVVQMTKELNMPVIAEGVETREQAEYLSSMGCYRIQGYYYSRPVPENDFIELMKKEK